MRKLLLLLPLLALGACGTNTTVTKLNAVTNADLTNAIVIDKANLPAEAEKLSCDVWFQAALLALQTEANGVNVNGVFSALSTADVASQQVVAAMSPTQLQAFEIACGPLVLHVEGTVTGLTEAVKLLPTTLAVIAAPK
jgi:hypothetical protein